MVMILMSVRIAKVTHETPATAANHASGRAHRGLKRVRGQNNTMSRPTQATAPKANAVLPVSPASRPLRLKSRTLAHGPTVPIMTPALAATAAIKVGR
ncbi:hypothetical protein C1S80_09585 [Mycolicibacterium aubagnense]|nr:hypothetical protein C1S80_09585 [Mycolicibacterium aubagnense]